MSITNRNERSSAIHLGIPWRGMHPLPDSTLNANDRSELATFFSARQSPVITSTTKLQKPVDYALAGDQDMPTRRGRIVGRSAVRHIFNE